MNTLRSQQESLETGAGDPQSPEQSMRPSQASKPLVVSLLLYVVALVATVRWHFSYGLPYHQATPALLAAFAISAALLGLLSIGAALNAIHWATRAAVILVGGAMLVGMWLLFYDWNRYLIWQMVVMAVAQIAFLVLLFAVARLRGFATKIQPSAPSEQCHSAKFSVRDLLVLMSGFAIFFAVMGAVRPVALRETLLIILGAGGLCAALVTAAGYWIRFSTSSLGVRILAGLLVAPLGGVVYAIAEQYASLMFSWRWYATVTSLQLLLIMIPLYFVRLRRPEIVGCSTDE